MHFGRVENVSGLVAELPPDSPRTERFLALPREGDSRLYIGCPIWASAEWVGDLYPKGTKPGKFLELYSRAFNTVELNSSFYHMPDPARVEQWRDDTPPEFRFCPKVFRGITEDLGTVHLPELIERFCATVKLFGSRLGLTFAQFSDRFAPAQWGQLVRFLSIWPDDVPLAVELRHPGWFRNHALPDEVVNLFYKRNVATLITDTAGRRDALHFSLTQPKVIVRFQGNEGNPLDESRIQEWGKRIAKWQSHRLREIYFFTHQPGDALIPATARFAVKQFTGVELLPVVEPPPAVDQLTLL